MSRLLIQGQGQGWPEFLLEAQGAKLEPTLDRAPFHHRATHTHTYSLRLGQYGPTSYQHAHIWDVGGNRSTQRKPTQTWGEHRDWQKSVHHCEYMKHSVYSFILLY